MGIQRGVTVRKSNVRNPIKIYVIATEGTTEGVYFRFIGEINENVEITIVPKGNPNEPDSGNNSDPQSTYRYLILFDIENRISSSKNKKLWLVTDRDRWGETKLNKIHNLCLDLGYNFGYTSPCFELWLYIHLVDINSWTGDDIDMIFNNQYVDAECNVVGHSERRYISRKIVSICGTYSKTSLKKSDFIPFIDTAIENAKLIAWDSNSFNEDVTTNMHLLVSEILNSTR